MNAAAVKGNRFRLPYLLVVTCGAIATTIYLIAPNTERWSAMTCWAVFVAAWGSTICAWRRHRPHLRHWSGVYTFGVVVVGFVGMLMLLSDLWLLKNRLPDIGSMPTRNPVSQYVSGNRILHAAITNNDLASVESILQTAEGTALLEGSGTSLAPRPLDHAVAKGRLQIAAVLLDHGAAVSDGLHNPLILAARRSDLPMMRLLIHHGASVNDHGNGSEPLWSAVMAGHSEAVNFLLKQGANPNTQAVVDRIYQIDTHHLTILQFARSQKNRSIVKLLLRAGAKQ